MKQDLESQIATAKSLDALLVLGGEENNSRTNHAYDLYSNIESETWFLPYIILSGKFEAEDMKNYLFDLGVQEGIMFTETESLDTLGNMVFSQPIIEEITL